MYLNVDLTLRTLIATICILGTMAFGGCSSAHLASKPGVYTVSVQPVHTLRGDVHATYIHPVKARHTGILVVFITGDDGWSSTSGALFEHLANEGYTVVGISAPEFLDLVADAERISTKQAAADLKQLFDQAKQYLGLPESQPVVMVGFSRGATAVAFSAVHPELRDDISGAVAIALTREADHLLEPEGEHRPEIQVDDQGRIQLYPALQLLGSTRFAVIQSSNDHYVPAAESRQLLGPDTSTLRLYPIEARDHGFSDAYDKLMQDLDDALQWIEETAHQSR